MAHFTALAEQGVCFIEKEYGVAVFAFAEGLLQMLFSLANPFRYYPRKVNLEQGHLKLISDDFRSQRFAGARIARK